MTRRDSFLARLVLVGALAAFAIPDMMAQQSISELYANGGGFTLAGPDGYTTVGGHATAIDGDTLIVFGVRVRLAEVDAPEREQVCYMPNQISHSGEPLLPWQCGNAATEALRHIFARSPVVTCSIRSTDVYGRMVASCATSEGDIAGQLVRRGLAVIDPRYSTGIYEDREAVAKAERLGVWSGEFQMPWEWRREHK